MQKLNHDNRPFIGTSPHLVTSIFFLISIGYFGLKQLFFNPVSLQNLLLDLLFVLIATYLFFRLAYYVASAKASFEKSLKLTYYEQLLAKDIFDNLSNGILITDKDKRIVKVNKRYTEITGYSSKESIGREARELRSSHKQPKTFYKEVWDHIEKNGSWTGEVWNRRKNGQEYLEQLSIYEVKNDLGNVTNYFGIFMDLNNYNKKDYTFWDMKDQLATILDSSPVGVIVCDQAGYIQLWGKQVEHIFNITHDVAKHKKIDKILPMISHHIKRMMDIPEKMSQQIVEIQAKTGKLKTLEMSVGSLRQQDGTIDGYQIVLVDISKRVKAEKKMEFFLNFDPLTKLYNNDSFLNHVIDFLKDSPEELAGLCMLDLDRFKKINDQFGPEVGDVFIKKVSERLKAIIGEEGIVGRLIGDEFAIFIPNLDSQEKMIHLAKKVTTAFQEPIFYKNQAVHLTISLGVSLYPYDGKRGEILLKNASLALTKAKRERNSYRFYKNSMNYYQEWFFLENELHQAIKNEDLDVHYQPQIDLVTGELWGVEALVRWNHSVRGMISPGEFIPIAEECGLIIPLGDLVLKQVCEDYLDWQEKGINMPSISINLSTKQFFRPDLVCNIKKTLETYNIPAHVFHIEITESVAMDIEYTLPKLHAIKELGLGISIDDFGTGYSSLKYLKELPIDFVKVDRSFIQDLNKDDTSIVQMIVQMAKLFNLGVVAEGIEEQDQEYQLKQLGCHIGQGFYYAKPMPPEMLLFESNKVQK